MIRAIRYAVAAACANLATWLALAVAAVVDAVVTLFTEADDGVAAHRLTLRRRRFETR